MILDALNAENEAPERLHQIRPLAHKRGTREAGREVMCDLNGVSPSFHGRTCRVDRTIWIREGEFKECVLLCVGTGAEADIEQIRFRGLAIVQEGSRGPITERSVLEDADHRIARALVNSAQERGRHNTALVSL